MTSLISAVARLAQATFTKTHSEESFKEALTKLRKLANQLSSSDVNFNRDLVNTSFTKTLFSSFISNSAPVTYISIHEDEDFSIGIFALKNSTKIPLHDHPSMHGIIKVIHGTINVHSYSALPRDRQYILPNEVAKRVTGWKRNFLVPTLYHGDTTVTSDVQETGLLTPHEHNYHEISTVNGSAAFVDILAPPYNNDRECHYYKIIATVYDSTLQKDITWLLESPDAVRDFWCDSSSYEGPEIIL